MIYRHTDEQIDEYYREPALNQSAIKVILDEGMESYLSQAEELKKKEEFGEKKHLVIGGAVDCKITRFPDSFDKLHHVSKLVKKPGKTALAVIRSTFDKVYQRFPATQIIELENYRQEIYEACNEEQYWMNRDKGSAENDNRIASLLKDNGQAYWEDLINADGKQVLVDSELSIIEEVTDSLLNHPHTAWIFKDSEDVDIIYQLPMFFKIKNTLCKSMTDIIRIEHSNKLIRIIDGKTIGRFVTMFRFQAKELRYDVQGSFYREAVIANIDTITKLIGRSIVGYRISFAFAVESTVHIGTPLVFPITPELIEQGKLGNGSYLQGWLQGVNTYESWAENAFELHSMVSDTNGVVWLDANFTYDKIF